jgi:hypothetical protein
MPSDEMKRFLDTQSPERRAVHEWVYEITLDPHISTLILGAAMVMASTHPEWDFWQVMTAVKEKIKVT